MGLKAVAKCCLLGPQKGRLVPVFKHKPMSPGFWGQKARPSPALGGPQWRLTGLLLWLKTETKCCVLGTWKQRRVWLFPAPKWRPRGPFWGGGRQGWGEVGWGQGAWTLPGGGGPSTSAPRAGRLACTRPNLASEVVSGAKAVLGEETPADTVFQFQCLFPICTKLGLFIPCVYGVCTLLIN